MGNTTHVLFLDANRQGTDKQIHGNFTSNQAQRKLFAHLRNILNLFFYLLG